MELTIEKYKEHVGGVQSAMKVDTLRPFFGIAKRELRKRIGTAMYDSLSEPNADEEFLQLCEGWACWYAHSLAYPHLKMKVGDAGIMKSSPANTLAITKWEYADTREANIEMQDMFLELVFEYLEEVQPQAWKASPEYVARMSRFIQSSKELQSIIPMVGKSSSFFQQLLTYISRAEDLYLAEILTEEVFQQVKESYMSGTLDATEAIMVDYIKKAVAHLAIYEAMPYLPLKMDEVGVRQVRRKEALGTEEIADKKILSQVRTKLYQDGEMYIKKLKKYTLSIASETKYPTFYAAWGQQEEFTQDYSQNSHIIL